jgi:hypothetical protein
MLRMMGIPSRVVTGFSPGSFNRETREYRVRDLDAHSWVEVYFTGIGWVPFDPTPTAAPAESQSSGLGATSAARADGGEVRSRETTGGASERSSDRRGGARSSGGRSAWPLGAALLALAAAVGGGWVVVSRRRTQRALSSADDLAELQLRELERALVKLGWRLPARTTLLGLERRLARAAGPGAARYVAKLRAHRFDPGEPTAPGAADRRALRRDLGSLGGLRAKLRGLIAIPPGGPRPGF